MLHDTAPEQQLKAIQELRTDLVPLAIEAEFEVFYCDFQTFLKGCEPMYITDLLNAIEREIKSRKEKRQRIEERYKEWNTSAV